MMMVMMASLVMETKTRALKKLVVVAEARMMSMEEIINANTVIKPTLVILHFTLTQNKSIQLVLMESKERHQLLAEAVEDPERM